MVCVFCLCIYGYVVCGSWAQLACIAAVPYLLMQLFLLLLLHLLLRIPCSSLTPRNRVNFARVYNQSNPLFFPHSTQPIHYLHDYEP